MRIVLTLAALGIGLSLAAPAMEQLDAALRALAGMLNAREDDFYGTE